MKFDDFENDELIQLINNYNHYSYLIDNNVLLNEININDLYLELQKRGIQKLDNSYLVKIEQITLLENNNIVHKEITNENLQINQIPQKDVKNKRKEQLPIILNFDQKYFSLYKIEGNSLNDLKINNDDLILVKNLPTKIKSKLNKLNLKFSSDTNNSNLLGEWISLLENYNSKLIVFKLKEKIFVKELKIEKNSVYLMSKNNSYFNYNLTIDSKFEFLGVVTNIIRNLD